jgi:hypothetical protein
VLSGSGTIALFGGVVRTTFGSLSIPAQWHVIGGVDPLQISLNSAPAIGDITHPLVNSGDVAATSGLLVVAGGSISNRGVFESRGPNSILGFNSSYSRADLGSLVSINGGHFGIFGTLDNAAQSFSIDSTTGDWYIGGTIKGGTLDVAAGRKLRQRYLDTATFDGVVLNGRMDVANTLMIASASLSGNADVFLTAPSLGSIATVQSTNGSLVIDAAVAVHGGGGYGPAPFSILSGLGNRTLPVATHVENHGQIVADTSAAIASDINNDFAIYGDLENAGTTGIRHTARIRTFGSVTSTAASHLQIELSNIADTGVFDIGGLASDTTLAANLDLTAPDDYLDLSLGPDVPLMQYVLIAKATGGITGSFDHVTPGFELRQTATTIEARAVPEPGIVIAVIPGLFALRRRRSNLLFKPANAN